MPGYLQAVRDVRGRGAAVQILWGEGDQTVPFAEHFAESEAMVETVKLEGLGHESIYEDPAAVGEKVLELMQRPV